MYYCPNCEKPNRETARFCRHCGTSLLITCPHCKAELPAGSAYCDQCGKGLDRGLENLASVRQHHQEDSTGRAREMLPAALAEKIRQVRRDGTLEGERRIVTILFCDLVGSTAAASKMDPETWTEIVNQCFEHMIQPVYRYEGTVARLMGDATLAFFGAPIAHEDDPERAIRAGLEIVRRFSAFRTKVVNIHGVEIDVRVGINTGLVLVGQVGSNLHMEYTAIGDAINLAARMEQMAQPGTVQIAAETRRYVRDLFDFDDLGLVTVKGKEAPVQAYRVAGLRAGLSRKRGSSDLTSQLIGREKEWLRLVEALEAVRRGVGQIVFLSGSAGLGKTRLIDELRALAKGHDSTSDEPVYWLQTVSMSYEITMPYAMVRRLLRRLAGSSESAPDGDLRIGLQALERGLPPAEASRLRRVLETLFNLETESAGPPLEGETFRGQLYAVLHDLLQRMASERPVIFVIDDLHWIDPASASLLEHLLDLVESSALLVLAASRPERSTTGWAVRKTMEDGYGQYFDLIEIEPLSRKEGADLIDHLLEIPDLPEDLRDHILERVDGNPLFVQEVARTLIAAGRVVIDSGRGHWLPGSGEAVEVPESIQTLLMSRIDQLQEQGRRVLQLAALIGRTFHYRVLAALSDTQEDLQLDRELETLQRAGFIRETARRPEQVFMFQHMLTQEAAYNTILHQQRRRYHKLVGETIESLFADHPEDHAARLAHHFYEGHDFKRAFRYNLDAGDAAMRLFASSEALKFYDQAVKLLEEGHLETDGTPDEELDRLFTRRGRAQELLYRFSDAVETYRELESLARPQERKALELRSLVLQGTAYSIVSEQYDPDMALVSNRRALELAVELDDARAQSTVYWNLMVLYRSLSRPEDAMQAGEKSLALAEEQQFIRQKAFTSNDLSYVYTFNARMEDAIRVTTRASELWREMGNQPMLADSLSALAGFTMITGDFEKAVRYSDEAYETSTEIQNIWGQSHSRYMIGLLYWLRGDLGRADEVMQHAGRLADQSGFMIGQIWARCLRACMLTELQMYAAAREYLDIAEARSATLKLYVPFIKAVRAYLDLLQGQEHAAITPFDFESGSTVSIFYASFTEQFRARCKQAGGESGEAIRILEALSAYEMKFQLQANHLETRFLLAEALMAAGREQEARKHYAAALEAADAMEARWLRWRIAAALARMENDPVKAGQMTSLAQADVAWILKRADGTPVYAALRRLPGFGESAPASPPDKSHQRHAGENPGG